ncbi:MAG TPA: YsnF/AvaK domain-containing protein, partial [Dissulfurispiraceae bacterium]
GGVRVYTHIVETPVEEKVTLREERAKVERRPAGRPATAAEKEAFREESIEIHETVEEPVVSKEARVKEEVVVGKEAREHTETIHETARRTEVEVEQLLDTEDQDFQRHFRSHYAGAGVDYDTYKPAYRYAGTIAQDPRYRDRDWPEIEGNVRQDWEKRHPGTWDKYKEAIHYGWEKVSRRPVTAGRG